MGETKNTPRILEYRISYHPGGRRKIKIEFINDKSRRHITFSKRKAGIMKKVCPPIFSVLSQFSRSLPWAFVLRVAIGHTLCRSVLIQFISLPSNHGEPLISTSQYGYPNPPHALIASSAYGTDPSIPPLTAHRHMNSQPSPALKSSCSSCPRPVSCIRLRLPSSNPSSPNPRARISSRPA